MKLSHLFFAALISVCMLQASEAQTTAQQTPASLNHIAIYVADLKVATDFYHDLFNLEKIYVPINDGKHTWLGLGPNTALHIISGATTKGGYFIDEHLCFSVPSIEIFIQKLKARNIVYMNFGKVVNQVSLRADGVHQIYFQDPDGHWLEVNDAKK
ncbi:MAG: VOC family protein [Mucilaginibacter sp.]